jgi:hypothetical protein
MIRILERGLVLRGSCRPLERTFGPIEVLAQRGIAATGQRAQVAHRFSSALSTADRNELSGGQIIAMMQTANSRHGYNLAVYMCIA